MTRSRRLTVPRCRLTRAVALGVALAGVVAINATVPIARADQRHFQVVAATVTSQLVQRPTRAEGALLPMIERLLQARAAERGRQLTRGIEPLTRRDAALAALRNNLTMDIASGEPQRLSQVVTEAEAVFDPVFDLEVGYTRNDTFTRTKIGTVRENVFAVTGNEFIVRDPLDSVEVGQIPQSVLDGLTPEQLAAIEDVSLAPISRRRLNLCAFEPRACETEAPVIRALEYYQDFSPDIVQDEITASPGRSGNEGHPVQSVNVTLGLTQELPWGGTLTLTDQTIWRKIYYDPDHYWKDGDWTTNFLATLETPIPFGRGFGADNANRAAIQRAEIARERADWSLRATINATLGAVDVAYFELVRQAESLRRAVRNQRLVRQLRNRTERLYDAGEGTRYQRAQAQNELVRAGLRVETALQDYINASIALARLIGNPDTRSGVTLYLPYAYSQSFEAELPAGFDDAWRTARVNRPELFVAALDTRSAEVTARQAEVDTRPDITLTASIASRQDNSNYGYAHPLHSHNRIIRPDTLNQSYTVEYQWPWMNRGLEAVAARAQLSVESLRLGERATELEVRREIATQLSDLQSARARVSSARREVLGRRRAYASLDRQREVGIVGHDELINALRQLLIAELAEVEALVDAEQAETELLVAQGTVANTLPRRTVQTRLDRRRVDMLADAGVLAYFGKPEASARR